MFKMAVFLSKVVKEYSLDGHNLWTYFKEFFNSPPLLKLCIVSLGNVVDY